MISFYKFQVKIALDVVSLTMLPSNEISLPLLKPDLPPSFFLHLFSFSLSLILSRSLCSVSTPLYQSKLWRSTLLLVFFLCSRLCDTLPSLSGIHYRTPRYKNTLVCLPSLWPALSGELAG